MKQAKRIWLNEEPETHAFMGWSVNGDQYGHYVDATVTFADCTRQVNLEFDIFVKEAGAFTNRNYMESLEKIEKIEKMMSEFKEALTASYAEAIQTKDKQNDQD